MVLSSIGTESRGSGDLCCVSSSLERQQFKLPTVVKPSLTSADGSVGVLGSHFAGGQQLSRWCCRDTHGYHDMYRCATMIISKDSIFCVGGFRGHTFQLHASIRLPLGPTGLCMCYMIRGREEEEEEEERVPMSTARNFLKRVLQILKTSSKFLAQFPSIGDRLLLSLAAGYRENPGKSAAK
eukprot:1138177-Pelagomonas_calceolata.AAC.4